MAMVIRWTIRTGESLASFATERREQGQGGRKQGSGGGETGDPSQPLCPLSRFLGMGFRFRFAVLATNPDSLTADGQLDGHPHRTKWLLADGALPLGGCSLAVFEW